MFLEKDLRIYRKKLHQYFPDDIEVDQERLKASIREGMKDETDNTSREESRDTSGEDLKLSNKDNDNSTVLSDAINEGSKPPLVCSASEPGILLLLLLLLASEARPTLTSTTRYLTRRYIIYICLQNTRGTLGRLKIMSQ